ncbi:alpha/beta hydrolase [Neobacillus ginsengisoli]|uniref:Alpha-beta hydrolase superfamily lysophospholipase n=1 Tax=Neobacillus ginsengisoli TaxID=904295 RepID=A0ABT9XVC4_9BACI|nr:alpha/beta hydrolase [Neobacillus ginsengisoli]MDQ0199517.1 alpha-beta hydrolase superfamily lysophospholipase [Neobacillus ginsengisoli]
MFYRVFKPSEPRAVVILVHGHGDHSGGLQNISERLLEHDYLAYTFDLRGHGKSPGVRGHIRKWEEYRGDLHAFRELVCTLNPGQPLYILGHSLGGVICLDYSLFHGSGISGVVSISPAISYEVTPTEKILITLMSKVKPDYTINKPGNPELLTQDHEIIKKLDSDPLRHNTVTPGLGSGLMRAIQRIMNQSQSIQMPFLLQYGLADEITPPEKLREFFLSVGSQEKQKLEYETARHRPFDDLERAQFLDDLLNWLDTQTKKQA